MADLTTTCTAELASASGQDGGTVIEVNHVSLDKADMDMGVKRKQTFYICVCGYYYKRNFVK